MMAYIMYNFIKFYYDTDEEYCAVIRLIYNLELRKARLLNHPKK